MPYGASQLATGNLQHGSKAASQLQLTAAVVLRTQLRPIKPGKSAYFTCQDFRENREEQVQDVRRSPLDRFMEFAAAATAESATASAASSAAKDKSHRRLCLELFGLERLKGSTTSTARFPRNGQD